MSKFPQVRILEQMISICSEDPKVMGLGTGGSLAHGNVDEYSDVDLFLLIEASQFESFCDEIKDIAKRLGEIAYDTVVPERNGFGLIHYWVLFNDSVRCEFNINTINSLKSHPFRKYTKIVVDKTGYYTEFLKKQKEIDFNDFDEFKRIVDEFWFGCEKLFVSFCRKNIWASMFYLDRLRSLLFQIIRLNSGKVFWPERPFRNFEKDFSNEINNELRNAISNYNLSDIRNSFSFIVYKFDKISLEIATKHQNQEYLLRHEGIKKMFSNWIKQSKRIITI